jgi:ribosome biogenesis protein Nip4
LQISRQQPDANFDPAHTPLLAAASRLTVQVKFAAALPRDQLLGMGCTFGKFTKSKKFKLHVTCLDYIAQYAQYKVQA